MAVTQSQETGASFSSEKMDSWFSEMISVLQADHFILESQTASDDKKRMYAPFINGDENAIHGIARMQSSIYFIRKTLNGYLNEILEQKVKLSKLAFDLSRSKILVWAEVFNDDEPTINQLILAEAKINADCFNNGFSIATTVVEQCDEIEVPSHYKNFDISRF